jgi:hypothetical protein
MIPSRRHVIIGAPWMRVVSPRSAVGVTPHSLYYDGTGDEVDCGTGASVMGLNTGLFTVDVYWQCSVALTGFRRYHLLSQFTNASAGWTMNLYVNKASYLTAGAGFLECGMVDSGGTLRTVGVSSWDYVPNAWYYFRYRRRTDTFHNASVNAGTESTNFINAGGGTTSADNLRMMPSVGFLRGRGNICYVHIWNTDKGALASVPTAPFAVDANTVGRWIHSDGAGATLTDTSGNANHGTISNAAWSANVPVGWTIA